MPFLSFDSIQITPNHLSRAMGESSKIVPTFTENWRLACSALHCHSRRVGKNVTFSLSQVGHFTLPSGQRSKAMKLSETLGSAKYRIASTSVPGSLPSDRFLTGT